MLVEELEEGHIISPTIMVGIMIFSITIETIVMIIVITILGSITTSITVNITVNIMAAITVDTTAGTMVDITNNTIYPLITAHGLRRATFVAIFARCTTSTTISTSL